MKQSKRMIMGVFTMTIWTLSQPVFAEDQNAKMPWDRPLEGDVQLIENCLAAGDDATVRLSCGADLTMACTDTDLGQSTVGMVSCVDAEIAAWDVIMSDRFDQLLTFAQEDDALEYNAGANFEEHLIDAQSKWQASRDADCTYENLKYYGGSVTAVLGANCVLQANKERALKLDNYVVTYDDN